MEKIEDKGGSMAIAAAESRSWSSLPQDNKLLLIVNVVVIAFGIHSAIPDYTEDWSWLLDPSYPQYASGLFEIAPVFLPVPILLLLILCKKVQLTRLSHIWIIWGLSLLPTFTIVVIFWPLIQIALRSFWG